jgi:hypothetical protein
MRENYKRINENIGQELKGEINMKLKTMIENLSEENKNIDMF